MPAVWGVGRSRTALGFSPLYAQAHRSQTFGHWLVRAVGRPPTRPQRFYLTFDYQAKSWDHPRRVAAAAKRFVAMRRSGLRRAACSSAW